MTIRATHEIHARRLGRNVGLAVVLAAFVGLVFALTVVKVTRGERMQGLDQFMPPAGTQDGTP